MIGTENRCTRTILTAIFMVFSTISTTKHNRHKDNGLIYILIWTDGDAEPFNFIDMGQKSFKKCAHKNCFLTSTHNYFKNLTDFDVIMFNIVALEYNMEMPSQRSPKQKYCMYSLDSAPYHVLKDHKFNGFFNITFTYKLASNITIPYIAVKNDKDETIGPNVNMHWLKLSEMNETSDYVKNKLKNKRIAAAWIVSHCETPFRKLYANNLRTELGRYGHDLDIYGRCGTKQCPKGDYGKCGNIKCPKFERMDECMALIETDYYFYLSFENAFSEDYVTEKLLHALEHFSVPVVFGRADYRRFIPDGIYLDANHLNPQSMAKKMNNIMNDTKKYYDFFKWHDHYSFHFTGENRYSEEMCRLCAFLNNSVNKTSVYDDILEWWNEVSPEWPTDTPPPSTNPTPSATPPLHQNFIELIVSRVMNFFDPSPD